MSSSTQQPRVVHSHLALTVAVAVLFAVTIPPAWIAYSDRETHAGNFLNFHPLFAVLYVPLAFGLIWPVLIRVAVWGQQQSGQSVKWPAKTALVIFILSACLSTPFTILEYRVLVRGRKAVRDETLRMSRFRAQMELEKQQALAELRSNGVASLSEPLTGPQTEAVNNYLDTRSKSPIELEMASQHYRTSIQVMEHLATMHDCPAPVLEDVFRNVTALQKDPPPQLPVNPYIVLYDLAWNPSLPVPILVQMLDNPYPQVREAAAANPRLPAEAKAAYMKKAAVSKSFSEREQAAASPDSPPEELSKMLGDENLRVRQAAAVNPSTPKAPKLEALRKMAVSERLWDRILGAQSPDCPPEELSKLSRDLSTAKYVAANTAAPIDVLQTLANSDDPETCRHAVANLTKRQKVAH